MVLHIALDGIDGVGKTTMVNRLQEFFTHKNYKCRTAQQPAMPEIIEILKKYNLTNHEIALLMAFDRSFTYYGEDWEQYDLVFWDRSILSSYAYNTDEKTPEKYVKQINKYFPLMDLYIIIKTDNIIEDADYTDATADLIAKYDNLTAMKNVVTVDYVKDQPNKVFEDIVKACFDNLPSCNWCPRLFKPNKKHKKYCSDKCAEYSLQEQYRVNNREYYKRYKNVMSERNKGGLGSKNANLHSKADPNPFVELEKVRRGKKALGLKPIQ